MKRFFQASAAIALLAGAPAALVLSPPAQATTFANLSIEQMTDASTAVIRGTVTETWTELDAYDRVWTRARVTVTDVFKGANVPSEIIVDQMGGTWQGYVFEIAGRAWFAPGEDDLMFLYFGPNGRWNVVEKNLGKFLVRRAPGETRLDLRNWSQPEQSSVAYDPRFLPHAAAGERVYLDDVVARVKDRAEKGWDGQPIPGLPAAELARLNLPENRMVKP